MILQLGISLTCSDHGLFLVLTGIPPPYKRQINQAHTIAYHNGNLTRNIAGRIFRTERLWSYTCQLYLLFLREWNIPMIFPTQYAIRYIAATVVFLLYPATFELINDNNATNGVGLACVM